MRPCRELLETKNVPVSGLRTGPFNQLLAGVRQANLQMDDDYPRKLTRGKALMSACATFLLAICLFFVGPGVALSDVPSTDRKTNLAFVLLSEAGLPKGEDIVRAFASFAPEGQRLRPIGAKNEVQSGNNWLEFDISSGGKASVFALPFSIPTGEAEDAVRFSVSAMGTGWKLPAYNAHLVVSIVDIESSSVVASLSCFTSFLAAVIKASPAVGVYWGNAGATHDSEFFMSTAREPGLVHRITLWTGVSMAREPDGRLSLLSLGMNQLRLPDLLLVASKSAGVDALETFFDLLGYITEIGKPLPEGDTVGRTEDERLPVHYVPSPIDPSKKVWRVELR